MAFKMRSGHKPGFKNMGSSPTEGGSALPKSSPMKILPVLYAAGVAAAPHVARIAGTQILRKGGKRAITKVGQKLLQSPNLKKRW